MSGRLLTLSKILLLGSLLVSLTAAPQWAAAEPSGNEMREFVMSCTYGVLAGTIVGAAMLAFTDQPGENLNKVARGASIGLYAGILLGFYVVYGVPEEPTPDMENGPSAHWRRPLQDKASLAFVPEIQSGQMTGALLQGQILSF